MTGQSESETEIQSEVIDVKEIEDYHKKKKKIEQQFICSYDNCMAEFKRLYRLKRHLRQHTGERPFVCHLNGCLRSFTCKTYLAKHQKRPHNIEDIDTEEKSVKSRKQYICGECEKSFKTKFQLRIHSYQHSGHKPFECNKCEKRFATQTKLKSHLKTHEGYVCGHEGCDYKTCKWSELRKHISVEHKICLKCEVCHKSFTNGYNLNLHKETIHLNPNEKIFCSYENCNKSYSSKSNLMTHIRVEHEKQVFKCPKEECLMTFLHKKTLNKHLENHSKQQIEKQKNKKCRRRVSKASQLTAIELSENEAKELMDSDLQFRKQLEENK